MLLFISCVPSRRKSYPKRIFHLKCDNCEIEFTRQNMLAETASSHTCSKKCKYERHARLQTKHDVVDRVCIVCHKTFSVRENRTKLICSLKCQVEAQRIGGILDLKKRQTFLEHFGADNPQRVPSIKQKTCETNIERYGCKVASSSDIVKEHARQTNLAKFGVEWHTQSENFAVKSKQTWVENYGVDHPMKSDVVKAKYDFKDNWRKAHETKKLNGTYASSADEERFHQRLTRLFSGVNRQVPVKHDDRTWHIDFVVNGLFVQFDGVYWHGLDRPLAIIERHETPRDIAIHTMWLNDRAQDAWFNEQGFMLVRITDVLEEKLTDTELLDLLTPLNNGVKRGIERPTFVDHKARCTSRAHGRGR